MVRPPNRKGLLIMNNDRRKRIDALADTVREFNGELAGLFERANAVIAEINDKIEEAKSVLIGELEEIRDEEQEAFDNMPEGFQNGERGELAQEAINNLEAAIGYLEGMDPIDDLNEVELEGEVADNLEMASNG